jgi:predicted metal-binding membrane protein
MPGALHRRDGWALALPLASAIAWAALAAGGSNAALPDFCAALVPLSASLDLALALNSPAQLSAAWALMIVAMMAPLIVMPLRHVRERSFARRRIRASLLFTLGYFAIWMTAGAALQATALVARAAIGDPMLLVALAAGTALVWQASPAKQWFLNRCHRLPPLAAFGAAADRDALSFGMSHGMACAGACWALMLPLLVTRLHFTAMIAVALFIFAERLEGPAPLGWRPRGCGKAMRIVAEQARLWFAGQMRAREVG